MGFLMGLVISKDPQVPERTRYFLGLQRHYWGNIHFYFSVAFVVLSLIYFILSWNWIKGKVRQLFHRSWLAMLSLSVVVLLLAFSLFWAFSPKAPRAYEGYGGKADSNIITDQMTLLDVEKTTGILAREIADALDLPSEISLNETLWQLRKSYPFTLQEVKDVVTKLLNEKELKIKEEVKPKELLHIEPKQRLARGRMASVPSGILITGKMTLYDLEDITGVPARKIADELGIPSNSPIQEHLGRLRKRYSFTMQKVRDVVASLVKKNR